ncbi:hypothetical protein C1A50_3609 [Paenibacillus polymyxa]|nr:hypothetical protein C1A50_3609 [Paenibacillus polymyxa]
MLSEVTELLHYVFKINLQFFDSKLKSVLNVKDKDENGITSSNTNF